MILRSLLVLVLFEFSFLGMTQETTPEFSDTTSIVEQDASLPTDENAFSGLDVGGNAIVELGENEDFELD